MSSHHPEASTSTAPAANAASPPEEHLPRDARLMALLLASKGIEDTTPQVLHQLLEFAHRYTTDILLDALTFNEHSGKAGKIDLSDVELAVQAKVNWEFKESGERDYLHPIAQKLNSQALPAVPETAFVRLPHPRHMLTAPNFNLLPNKPPPGYGADAGSDEDDSDDDEGSDEDGETSASLASPQVGTVSAGGLPPAPNGHGAAPAEDEDMSDDDDDDDDEMMQVVDIPSLPTVNPSGVGEKRVADDDDDDDYDA